MAIVLDNTAFGSTGANASYNITIVIGAALSNQALVLLAATNDSGTAHLTGVSGPSGATWSAVGTRQVGTGTFNAECWIGTGFTASGSQLVALTYNTAPSTALYGIVYSLSGVAQSSSTSGTCYSATAGNLVIPTSSGDMAISADFDNISNRTVTGCTSSTDLSAFTATGYSGAHCTSSPSSTFTWSGFGNPSIAIGADIKPLATAGGRNSSWLTVNLANSLRGLRH